jgi:hypothetical protein
MSEIIPLKTGTDEHARAETDRTRPAVRPVSKKPKAPTRELATIVAEIHETFRNDTASVVKRGDLLIEAKQQVKHGEWLLWLDTYFCMDARTAQRAMAAAKFAAKYDTAVVFNLNVDALYALSGGDFATKVVAAVMAKAATQPIRTRTIYDIEESLEPPPQATKLPDPEKDVAALRLVNEFGSLMKSLKDVTANRRPEYFRGARVDPKVAAKLGQFLVDLAPILAGNGVDQHASPKAMGEKHAAAETAA